MLAEYGTMSLKQVLTPAMQMADGYPMEDETARSIERNKERIKQWPYSKAVFLPHAGQQYEAPEAGEIFRTARSFTNLTKMVDAEQEALKKERTERKPSMLLMIVFIKEILQKNLFAVARNKADSLLWKILPNGNLYRKNR